MPIYEYRCICGNNFRVLKTENQEADNQKCPRCGSSKLEKAIASSIIPNSDDLQNIKYPDCIGCIKRDCDACNLS